MIHNAVFAKSEHIESVQYDDQTDVLTVDFVGGHRYRYANVPRETYDNLASASSPGSYFHERIRGRYVYRRA